MAHKTGPVIDSITGERVMARMPQLSREERRAL